MEPTIHHNHSEPRLFVSLGMFIIDEFEYVDASGRLHRPSKTEIGGGGTYAAIGARMWLPPESVGLIVDRGHDFPEHVQERLKTFGEDMWLFRDDKSRVTTRGLNTYRGDSRQYRHLTSPVRISPRDLMGTKFERPTILHIVSSPARAVSIVSEISEHPDWQPTTIYEPSPDDCTPEGLPSLLEVLPLISILSPNAEEALSLLSIPLPVTVAAVEQAATQILDCGVGRGAQGTVLIRSGNLGAYVASEGRGQWVDAFWKPSDASRVVDVTGAGNAFLGGLAAGLAFANGDVFKATLYATVSASFVIEQEGLPQLCRDQESGSELWNGESPEDRWEALAKRTTV